MPLNTSVILPHDGMPMPPRVEPRTGTPAMLTAIENEIAKGLIDLWGGRIGSLLELILFGVFYVVITFAMGYGRLVPSLLASTLLGFVGYMFFHMQTNRLFWGILGEAQNGTLEQLYLSPLPSWVLTIGMAAASIIEAAVSAAVLYLGAALVLRVTIPWRWDALVPIAALVVGSVGYSLILGGLTLKFKRVEILKELFQLIVMIFGGVFIPVARMPGQMATFARLLPLTPGLEALRRSLLAGASLGDITADGTLLTMLVSAAVYLAVGIIAFRWFEGVARREGTLGQY